MRMKLWLILLCLCLVAVPFLVLAQDRSAITFERLRDMIINRDVTIQLQIEEIDLLKLKIVNLEKKIAEKP